MAIGPSLQPGAETRNGRFGFERKPDACRRPPPLGVNGEGRTVCAGNGATRARSIPNEAGAALAGAALLAKDTAGADPLPGATPNVHSPRRETGGVFHSPSYEPPLRYRNRSGQYQEHVWNAVG